MNREIKEINSLLKEMSKAGGTSKGSYGELAVLKICEKIYREFGGILYHSYSYKVDKDLPGNIKKKDGVHYLEALGSTTEIDILLVTPFRVFPIEVKAYKAKNILLTDEAIDGCYMTDKSPIHQHEMHLRHLYSTMFEYVPEGRTEYLVPIVVFVDKCKLTDSRSLWQREYILVTVLKQLEALIRKNNNPLDYRIDLDAMTRCLLKVRTSYEKYLRYREEIYEDDTETSIRLGDVGC